MDDVNGGRLIFYDFGMMGRYASVILCSSESCQLKTSFKLQPRIFFRRLEHLALASCSISQNIREGLLEVFYGVYEKDPNKVIVSLSFIFLVLRSSLD